MQQPLMAIAVKGMPQLSSVHVSNISSIVGSCCTLSHAAQTLVAMLTNNYVRKYDTSDVPEKTHGHRALWRHTWDIKELHMETVLDCIFLFVQVSDNIGLADDLDDLVLVVE
jgi:hypothetical protein